MSVAIRDLDGTEIHDNGKPTTIGSQVYPTLARANYGDPVKMMDWAITIMKGTPLTLDDSDKQLFRKHLTETPLLTNLVKKQALDLLNNGVH